jgi:hypothetical protein
MCIIYTSSSLCYIKLFTQNLSCMVMPLQLSTLQIMLNTLSTLQIMFNTVFVCVRVPKQNFTWSILATKSKSNRFVLLFTYCTKENIFKKVVQYTCLSYHSYCKSLGNSGNRDGCCIQAALINVSSGLYITLPYTHHSPYFYTILSCISHFD